jgi:hypothetical protein
MPKGKEKAAKHVKTVEWKRKETSRGPRYARVLMKDHPPTPTKAGTRAAATPGSNFAHGEQLDPLPALVTVKPTGGKVTPFPYIRCPRLILTSRRTTSCETGCQSGKNIFAVSYHLRARPVIVIAATVELVMGVGVALTVYLDLFFVLVATAKPMVYCLSTEWSGGLDLISPLLGCVMWAWLFILVTKASLALRQPNVVFLEVKMIGKRRRTLIHCPITLLRLQGRWIRIKILSWSSPIAPASITSALGLAAVRMRKRWISNSWRWAYTLQVKSGRKQVSHSPFLMITS